MARQFPIREPSIEALAHAPVYFRYGSNSNKTLVDALTASAIRAVYDGLNEDNKAKLARMIATPDGLYKIATFAFKQVSFRAA